MRIIIEGCECTGKSTLAQWLSKKYNLKIRHITSHDKNSYRFYKKTIKKNDIIYDRHFIGEMIYPAIYKRKGKLNEKKFEKLLKKAKENSTIIFLLYCDKKTLMKRYKARGKIKIKNIVDNMNKINEKFIEIGRKYWQDIIMVDTTKGINYGLIAISISKARGKI